MLCVSGDVLLARSSLIDSNLSRRGQGTVTPLMQIEKSPHNSQLTTPPPVPPPGLHRDRNANHYITCPSLARSTTLSPLSLHFRCWQRRRAQ